MALTSFYIGSTGPFQFDAAVDTYPDGSPLTEAFKTDGGFTAGEISCEKLFITSPTATKYGSFECSDTMFTFLAQGGPALIFGNNANYLQFYTGSGKAMYFDAGNDFRFRNGTGGAEVCRIYNATGIIETPGGLKIGAIGSGTLAIDSSRNGSFVGVTATTFNAGSYCFYASGNITRVSKVAPSLGRPYPTSVTGGEIVLDAIDGHFYGYNGAGWVQLDN